jgi:hypothetical protein
MKITIETDNPEDEVKLKRMFQADDAISLLWEISQRIRTYQKHEEGVNKSEVIDEIQQRIADEDPFKHWN